MSGTRLYRSRDNRMIAGVAGGLAEYVDVDVTVVRLLWILSVFLGGGGILAYVVAWVIIPENKGSSGRSGARGNRQSGTPEGREARSDVDATPTGEEDAREEGREDDFPAKGAKGKTTQAGDTPRERRRRSAGLLLVGLGVIFLIRRILPWQFFYFSWPLLLVAIGLFLMFRNGKEGNR